MRGRWTGTASAAVVGVGLSVLRPVQLPQRIDDDGPGLLDVDAAAALADAPETVNSDPYGAGWLVEVQVTGDGDPTAELLDAAAYEAVVAGS